MIANKKEKKIYKTKKALDTANKAKGELGKKQKIIKYIIEQYINYFPTAELKKQAIEGLGTILKPNRDVLINLRKNHKIQELDYCTLLARDVILLLISSSKEKAHFDFADKYKKLKENTEVMDIFKENFNGEIVGYDIKLSIDDEIELFSLFDGNNLIEKADNAIKLSKWALDALLEQSERNNIKL
jgi:hypothetical protein